MHFINLFLCRSLSYPIQLSLTRLNISQKLTKNNKIEHKLMKKIYKNEKHIKYIMNLLNIFY